MFADGDLIQVYRDRLDSMMATEQKLVAKWFGPMEVIGHYLNLWKLQPLGVAEGDIIEAQLDGMQILNPQPLD